LEAQEFMADILLTTEKDSLKLRQESFEKPLFVLRIEIEITKGQDQLDRALTKTLQPILSSTAGTLPKP
ncbi:MAG: hypothetical protein QF645_11065, partial [Planctomycetota bacterium]|nr:hypothetical protein [Planctomycetota bacterium]